MTLKVLDGSFAICRFDSADSLPAWAGRGPFISITRAGEELSVVCPQEVVPEGVRCERDWRCLRIVGTLDFALVGVLASLLVPLADACVSVFAVSTFDTDYLLVKQADLQRAVDAVLQAGHALCH